MFLFIAKKNWFTKKLRLWQLTGISTFIPYGTDIVFQTPEPSHAILTLPARLSPPSIQKNRPEPHFLWNPLPIKRLVFPILSPLPPIHIIPISPNSNNIPYLISLASFLLNECAKPPDLKHIKQPLRVQAQERLNSEWKVYGGLGFSGARASFLPALHHLLTQTRGGNNGIAGSFNINRG